MLAFMLIQYTNSLIRSCVSSIPMWLLYNGFNICFCNVKGIIIHLPFIPIPSIIARSCLIVQYPSKLRSISSFINGQHHIMSVSSICSSVYSLIAALKSSINVQTGTSTVVHIVWMLILIPAISSSLFSMWF